MKTTAFLVRVFICFLLALIPLTDLENRIYSTRMELRGHWSTPKNILILNIEPRDFNLLKRRFSKTTDSRGQSWAEAVTSQPPRQLTRADRMESMRDLFYWDPAVFREVLRNLLGQDPASILVSWYIPNEVVESESDAGVELLARNPRVLWSSEFDSDGKFLRPPGRLAATGSVGANFGFNNLVPDSDGVVRRSWLAREHHDSLTFADFERTGTKAARIRNPSEPFLINYMGPPGTVPLCRLLDVLNRKAPADCQNLHGKHLLLTYGGDRSSTDSVRGSFFLTPLGEMSRAEIVANEINTIVNHQPIYRASWLAQAFIILAMILGAAFYIIYYPVLISAIAVTGTGVVVALVLFQLIFQLSHVYIPSANVCGSLLITYLIFTGYRLAVQENLQWRSLKQAQYLRELDQLKTNFLSLVSHDLKTPIAKIQAVVERLKNEAQLPPEERADMKELIDSIENSNNELKHYITSILNLSRIESQKVILNKKSNDINRIIQQVLKRLKSVAQQKNIRIEEQLEPLFSVECDEDLIRQVLTNLVDNALKYSPEGSRVIIRSTEEDGFVRVDVEDFGPGIPKAHLPLMFRKFSRFLRPIHEQVKGTGLGLYLSKFFIELHGGSIRLKSVEGQGTTFTFTLPVETEQVASEAERAEAPQG